MNRRSFLKGLAALGIVPLPVWGRVAFDTAKAAHQPPEELPDLDPQSILFGDPIPTVTRFQLKDATFYVADQPLEVTQCLLEVMQEYTSLYEGDKEIDRMPMHRTVSLSFNIPESSIYDLARKCPELGQGMFTYAIVHSNELNAFYITGEKAVLYSEPDYNLLTRNVRLDLRLLGDAQFVRGAYA
jgi:hypothetical protein